MNKNFIKLKEQVTDVHFAHELFMLCGASVMTFTLKGVKDAFLRIRIIEFEQKRTKYYLKEKIKKRIENGWIAQILFENCPIKEIFFQFRPDKKTIKETIINEYRFLLKPIEIKKSEIANSLASFF